MFLTQMRTKCDHAPISAQHTRFVTSQHLSSGLSVPVRQNTQLANFRNKLQWHLKLRFPNLVQYSLCCNIRSIKEAFVCLKCKGTVLHHRILGHRIHRTSNNESVRYSETRKHPSLLQEDNPRKSDVFLPRSSEQVLSHCGRSLDSGEFLTIADLKTPRKICS